MDLRGKFNPACSGLEVLPKAVNSVSSPCAVSEVPVCCQSRPWPPGKILIFTLFSCSLAHRGTHWWLPLEHHCLSVSLDPYAADLSFPGLVWLNSWWKRQTLISGVRKISPMYLLPWQMENCIFFGFLNLNVRWPVGDEVSAQCSSRFWARVV